MSNQQLIGITKEAKDIQRDERAKPLLECPYDGHVLEYRNGIYNCPLGNFRTRKTTREPFP